MDQIEASERQVPHKMTAVEIRWDKFISALNESRWTDVPGSYMAVYGSRDRIAASKAANKLFGNETFQEFMRAKFKGSLEGNPDVVGQNALKIWFTRAFYKLSDILDDDGQLKCPIDELKEKGLDVVIDSIEIKVTRYGRFQVVKLADRAIALQRIAEFLKITTPPSNATSVNVVVDHGEPKIMTIQRLTVEEWKEFYNEISSGGHSPDKSMP